MNQTHPELFFTKNELCSLKKNKGTPIRPYYYIFIYNKENQRLLGAVGWWRKGRRKTTARN